MDPLTTGLLIALMVASFYFLIIRPNRKRQAEQAKLADSMQPGSRVMLNSGIYGTVADVGEKQVGVELAPGVRILVLKQAVLQVVTPGSQFAEDAPVIEDRPADPVRAEDRDRADDEWPGSEARLDALEDHRSDDDTDPRGTEGQKG